MANYSIELSALTKTNLSGLSQSRSCHLSETLAESSHINQFVAGALCTTGTERDVIHTRGHHHGMSFDVIS